MAPSVSPMPTLAYAGLWWSMNASTLEAMRVVDTTNETVISLAQAADELPRRRRGRKTHVSTLYRWTTSGCRGVILETIQVGATRCTSREALQRFFERLSAGVQAGASPGDPSRLRAVPGGRTIAQRQRASAEAGRKLAKLGA